MAAAAITSASGAPGTKIGGHEGAGEGECGGVPDCTSDARALSDAGAELVDETQVLCVGETITESLTVVLLLRVDTLTDPSGDAVPGAPVCVATAASVDTSVVAAETERLCCEDVEALGLALTQRVPPRALREPPATLLLRVGALPVGKPLAAAVPVEQ